MGRRVRETGESDALTVYSGNQLDDWVLFWMLT